MKTPPRQLYEVKGPRDYFSRSRSLTLGEAIKLRKQGYYVRRIK